MPCGVVGLVAFGGVAALAERRAELGAALAGAIALSWCIAGLIGVASRAPRPSLLFLELVGVLHLTSFTLSGWLAELAGSGGWVWGGQLLAQLLFGAGFLALAMALATYPHGVVSDRSQRLLLRAGVLVLGVQLAQQALFSASVEPVVDIDAPVSTPWQPLAELPSVAMPALLLLVVAGVIVLVVRRRAIEAGDRRVYSWAAAAGITLATAMLAAPAGTALLGDLGWTLLFLAVAGSVPFLLLAGLAGWRLGSVDRYVVRLLSRGLLIVAVLTAYAALAAVASRAWPVAVLVTLAAALLGAPALRRLERWGDRWITGGRVRGADELDELTGALATVESGEVGRLATEAVQAATGASWCRLIVPGVPPHISGRVFGHATLTLPLRAAGQEVGQLECGPRPGGWTAGDAALLEPTTSHAALALRNAALTAELGERVQDLAASRGRLVRAEETVRRQVERDLHDGLQQQLVALFARLEVARHVAHDPEQLTPVLESAHSLAGEALSDLRALTAGIHPALLADRGVVVAVRERAAQLPIAVTVDADPRLEEQRFPPEVEGAAYFVIAEALTNVVKHSGAVGARVVLTPAGEGGLRVAVVDEGTGAASYDGSGLAGLRDRVDALGGTFTLNAVPGVGTTVVADLGPSNVLADR